MDELYKILQKVRERKLNVHDGHDTILSLIGENELSVSDDSSELGDLHGVRECHASDKTEESNESSVDGTLGNIIDSENVCLICGTEINPRSDKLHSCDRIDEEWLTNKKES